MRVTKMVFALGGAAAAAAAIAAAGTAAAKASPAAHALGSGAGQPKAVGPAAAGQSALSYASAHHPGPKAARVLATEADTDRGRAVYDVRVLAPDGITYVVHISRASNAVLWAGRAETQAGTSAGAPPGKSPHGEAERAGSHPHSDRVPGARAGDG